MARLTINDARRLAAAGRPWCFRMEFSGVTAAGNPSNKFWLVTGRAQNEPVEVRYGALGTAGQVIVKTWAYVEAKAAEKEAKGYSYEDTPFIRVRQATIDAHAATTGQRAPQPRPRRTPKPPRATTPATPPMSPPSMGATGPTPGVWKCPTGKVTVTPKGNVISVEFAQGEFPQPWCNETLSGMFKAALEAKTGCKVFWADTEVFNVRTSSKSVFLGIVAWLQGIIPGLTTPLNGAPALTGPFKQIATVKPMGKGKWAALRADGRKLMDLTAKGARDLVADYPQITIAGV